MKAQVVNILGVDGSGKTTLADTLAARLKESGKAVVRRHWRPYVLPSPRRFLARKAFGDPQRPHRAAVHPRWVSSTLLFYYRLDFALLRFKRIPPCGCVIIHERPFVDAIVDPLRHRLDLSERMLAWSVRAAQEGLYFALFGSEREIHARKPELAMEEIRKQQGRLKELCRYLPGVEELDCTGSSAVRLAARIQEVLDGSERRWS